MKLLLRLFLASTTLLVLLISGCDLTTQSPVGQHSPAGRDLFVSEIFTISPDKYYSYSWLEIYNPTGRTISWFEINSPVYARAIGTQGTILRTSDGGQAWDDSLSLTGGAGAYALNSMTLPNSDTGFVVGNHHTLLKIHPQSVSNISRSIPATLAADSINFNGIDGPSDLSNRVLFLVGDYGTYLRSLNGGATWTKASVPAAGFPRKHLRGVAGHQQPKILMVGDTGTFYYSVNTGTNWTASTIPEPYRTLNFYAVATGGKDTAFAVGENGSILITTNGGILWSSQVSNVTATLRGVFAPAAQGAKYKLGTVWAVGDGGTVITTTDNGADWTVVDAGVQSRLNSIVFSDSSRGWIYGDQGMILATIDGGQTWRRQPSNSTSDLRCGATLPSSLSFINEYVLTMYAERDFVFYDTLTRVENDDVILRRDTALIGFTPFEPARGPGFPVGVQQPPGTFLIVRNDPDKFADHNGQMGQRDAITKFADSRIMMADGVNRFKWKLLPSSEVRLVQVSARLTGGLFDARVDSSSVVTKFVDVVRFGNFRPPYDDFPNNTPFGEIPEFWSLARYSDDFGDDPRTESTIQSFYKTRDPIPGWYSQERKPH